MASVNSRRRQQTDVNAEGATVRKIGAEDTLRRAVMSGLLWESSFYESGDDITKRIQSLIPKVDPEKVAAIAIEARERFKLRHMPLFIVREMARLPEHKGLVKETLARVVQRADELTEFLAIYWKDDKTQPLSAQVKKGLALAFNKFGEYDLAKYNRDREIKIRDVMFLTHPKPTDAEGRYTKEERKAKKRHRLTAGEKLFRGVTEDTLATPDTWEVALSAGEDKRETWIRLIDEKKLGALALLRNLRNMRIAHVPDAVIRQGLNEMKVERVLPYRLISAARYAPNLEPELEQAMYRCVAGMEKLAGKTALIVDTSPSMWQANISAKSDMSRFEAAAALAILVREVCEEVEIFAFNHKAYQIPNRRGFALRDALPLSYQGEAP